MLLQRSVVNITDSTATTRGMCIFVLRNKKAAFLGDCILLSIRGVSPVKVKQLKLRLQRRFSMGTMHRGLVLRSKVFFSRFPGVFIKFNVNACVLVNRRVVPVSNRIYGPVLREFCMRWPSIGCVTHSFL